MSADKLLFQDEDLLSELEAHLETIDGVGPCLRHPLVYAVPYVPQLNAMLNAQFRYKTERITEASRSGDWATIVALHEKPYRFQALDDVALHLSDDEYWELLGECWTGSENLHQVEGLCEFLNADRPGKESMMNETERAWFTRLPERIVVYRGCTDINRAGFSWTLSPIIAERFAKRFARRGEGLVVRGQVAREHVHAVFLSRGETEVVADPDDVTVSPAPLVKRPKWLQSVLERATATFALGRGSIHGPSHWLQVERNALALCKLVPGADPVVCRLFAMLHDCRRENEYDDPEHGARAADYATTLDLPINAEQRDKLVLACRDHNSGATSDDPTIGVCWDADRLDLPRVGVLPERRYLSHAESESLLFQV